LVECDHKKRLSFIDPNCSHLSVSRQIELLGISRSSYYYVPVIDPEQNILLTKLDSIYTEHPFLGSRRLSRLLKKEGYSVGRCKVASLMKILGIRVLYPHKKNINTTISNPEHKKYPYLLRGLEITHANQVWSTDITYIRMNHGFIYLIAVIDWYSRKVLSWKISTSMDVSFCTQALQEAIDQYGTPEIFNTDQ
jgi:putative transposase